jgi:DNA-binding MarR family transcriptional regulator
MGSVIPLVWARLAQVTQKIRRAADNEVRSTGYTTAQFAILFEVHANPGRSQQELADRLQLTKGNIAQLVEKLRQDSLLERVQDGRLKRLSLTPQGQQFVDLHLTRHDQFITRQFAALSQEELDQLYTLLRKLDRSLR